MAASPYHVLFIVLNVLKNIVCGQVRTYHVEIVDVVSAANVQANISCKDVCSGLPASESLNLQFVSI